MKAETRTLQTAFVGDRRFVVPVYQRPYVWEKDLQWEPLWNDVEATTRRLAETRALGASKHLPISEADRAASPHFLGAIVLEQIPNQLGTVETRLVVDGQQRLTTIQLLLRGVLDAIRDVEVSSRVRATLTKAVRNDEEVVDASELLKVTPRRAEVAEFTTAMEMEQVNPESSVFAAARDYFAVQARSFLQDDDIPHDPYADAAVPAPVVRADVLVAALLGLIKLVVIELEDVDDAQIIFEALNARGTSLSATDLVKNLLFLRAQTEHHDSEQLYEALWRRFDDDDDWWRETTGVGHTQRARQDWLLGDWMIAEQGATINVGRIYSEFRKWLDVKGTKAFDALATLNRYADAYESLGGRRPGSSRIEREVYRRIDNLGITVATPLFLWLQVQPSDVLHPAERELAFQAVESYVVRRMAAKLQTRSYGAVFVEILKAAQGSGSHCGFAAIKAFRDGPYNQNWPDTEDIIESFRDGRYYGPGGINQERLRLILGAIDDRLQDAAVKAEPIKIDYTRLQIEHIIPQDWQQKWPVTATDRDGRIVAEIERERHINRIGNLTLVTDRLNPAISNHPWTTKKAELKKHSKLELNRQLVQNETWDEAQISARGVSLALEFDRIWPGPDDSRWLPDDDEDTARLIS